MKFNNTKSKIAAINPVYKEKWNLYRSIIITSFEGYIYIQVNKLVIVSQDINYIWNGICSRYKHSG